MKKVKKVLSLILCSLLLIGLVPVAAQAEDESEPPAVEAPEFSGSGTEEDPYQISSAEDLMHLAKYINDGKGNFGNCYFRQTDNIDLTGKAWEPIGYSGDLDRYFAGHYDGYNHFISNATSTGKNDNKGYATAGIFGWVAFGSVQNLHVRNSNFSGTGNTHYAYVGGICGVSYNATITNCSVSNTVLDSKGLPTDTVTAGGVSGYSLNSTYSKCASIGNTVNSYIHAGGFVGEIDSGLSSFTDCYVTNGSVTSTPKNGSLPSIAGGFCGSCGSISGGKLKGTNCYVYGENIKDTGKTVRGIFAAIIDTTYQGSLNLENSYSGNCGEVTENAGTTVSQAETQFTDGTVVGHLGDSFIQGKDYPVLKDAPADYTEVDRAIAKANALTSANYKNFSGVTNAIDKVARDKTAADQSEVDKWATDIKDAINSLQLKDADYTKVDAALEKVKALNKADYENFDAVEKAVNAVVQGKNITEQANVDAMAKAIEDAITNLQLKGADYTKVDDALEKVKALNKADYENFDAVEKAVKAVDRKKNITEQATVDKYAEDIEKAIASLKRKPDPSKEPTGEPPKTPSETLTGTPTPNPTKTPTTAPTSTPTTSPAKQPTAEPSKAPTTEPTKAPTTAPQSKPTAEPSVKPSTDTNKSAEKKETPLYRLYNPHSGEHFYTKEPGEKDALVKIGWKYEGQAWSSPETGIPVYRLYNPNAGDHFYTTSVGERKYLVKLGWKYEGIGWYAVRKGRAVYRLYNPNAKGAGSHHYTTSIGERAILIKLGWRAEGIAWDAI